MHSITALSLLALLATGVLAAPTPEAGGPPPPTPPPSRPPPPGTMPVPLIDQTNVCGNNVQPYHARRKYIAPPFPLLLIRCPFSATTSGPSKATQPLLASAPFLCPFDIDPRFPVGQVPELVSPAHAQCVREGGSRLKGFFFFFFFFFFLGVAAGTSPSLSKLSNSQKPTKMNFEVVSFLALP
jgi:hypothetical protein